MSRTLIAAALAAAGLFGGAAPAAAQQIQSQSRSVYSYATTFDYYFDDITATDEEKDSSTATGLYAKAVSASAGLLSGGASASAMQDSTVDAAAKTFGGEGRASADLAVQADGGAPTAGIGESKMEVTFRLTKRGGINLDLSLETLSTYAGGADASATFEVINLGTGAVVFSRTIGADDSASFAGTIPLRAGRYKVVARAAVTAGPVFDGEVYEDGVARFDFTASLFQN
jgi:hypothetical protein